MSNPSHYVLNGHTLGYIYDEHPNTFGVLHGSVLLGGHDWRNGPVTITDTDQLVPATLEDFDKFRVCPKGHIS